MSLPPPPQASQASQSPAGEVFVVPRQDAIDFIDVGTGKMRARVVVPEPLVTPQNVADIKGDLTIDASGLNVYAITQSGMTVVQLDSLIDDLPQPQWPVD